jgi:glycosyltransferase involved in cell wall biosynthesis
VLRRAQAVTAVSSYTANQVRAVFDRQVVTVIPNGIDTVVFQPGPDRPPHQPFRLLFIGNWSRRKGTDLLAPIMRTLGSDFELWVTSGLRDWRDKTPLPPNIRFLGRVPTTEALVRVYQDADALLFPSRLEGFGLAILEAMACGLPVLAARVSAIPEIVRDQVTGFLCPLDDSGAFVHAVTQVSKDFNRRSAIRIAAYEDVRERFTQRAVTQRYIQVYDSVSIPAQLKLRLIP